MAPRRRPSKKLTNAAVKGLEPLGFPRNTIVKTVNTLLKAYGGEGGWRFIAEDSYKLVVERILEDQEEKEAAEKKEENAEGETEDPTVCNQNSNDVNVDNVNSESNFPEGSINWRDIPIARCWVSEPTIPIIPRRAPCYGWISESEDESDDPPAHDENK